uniref:Uncharacterized protein n=1 Tax=Pipistrellus kuhlii TaxID=59472 RepID=A0A7J7W393_PIPKU|nr:hypothetical protein mPipKuh1_008202 [Pipistrellus kuhlii]
MEREVYYQNCSFCDVKITVVCGAYTCISTSECWFSEGRLPKPPPAAREVLKVMLMGTWWAAQGGLSDPGGFLLRVYQLSHTDSSTSVTHIVLKLDVFFLCFLYMDDMVQIISPCHPYKCMWQHCNLRTMIRVQVCVWVGRGAVLTRCKEVSARRSESCVCNHLIITEATFFLFISFGWLVSHRHCARHFKSFT